MAVSLSKYRGCLMGGLIGDCMGSPFEFTGKLVKDSDVIKHLETPETSQGGEKYTDDTEMAWALSESFIENLKYNAEDVAKRFAEQYFKNGLKLNRGYGDHVVDIFDKWQKGESRLGVDTSFDVYLPAREQFSGTGSYGNGGAMRIAPVALFEVDNYDQMIDLAKRSTLLTHFHHEGYNGAILQCCAVWLALRMDPASSPLDVDHFLNRLIDIMKTVEAPTDKGDDPSSEDLHRPYTKKLNLIKDYLQRDVSKSDIISNLGHGVSAIRSVPTAIYSFLKATKSMNNFPMDNAFLRTVGYAIAFGGDADTIGTMAGSIAGAYYGIEAIPEALQKRCERYQHALDLADKLYHLKQ